MGGNYSASPLLAAGRIYLQNEEAVGVVLAPGKTFQELARNSIGERTLASYAVTDGALFIRTEAHIYRVDNLNKHNPTGDKERGARSVGAWLHAERVADVAKLHSASGRFQVVDLVLRDLQGKF